MQGCAGYWQSQLGLASWWPRWRQSECACQAAVSHSTCHPQGEVYLQESKFENMFLEADTIVMKQEYCFMSENLEREKKET